MKTTRRQFIATAGSALAALPLAAADTSRDSRITHHVSRPLAIDCQSHLFCPEVVALMEKRDHDPVVRVKDGQRVVIMADWVRRFMPRHTDVDAKLADMDAAGIAITALSINDPGPEWFGADGPAVAQMMNDFIGGIVKQHPKRFLGLCVLPLQDGKAAQPELDRCVRQLGMKGILLYASDHPWVDPKLILDGLRSLKLPAKEEAKILQDNARKLFNL
jgi:predicted TIM-barrel fold metal-dependent hydrolase